MDANLQTAISCAEAFYLSSGLGCALTDGEGNVLYAGGQSYDRCRVCALACREKEECLSVHRHGVREAERFGGRYIYSCAMGLTCFTSPVIGKNGVETYFTAGPLLMVDEQDYAAYDLSEVAGIRPEMVMPILNEVRALPYVEARRVTALSQMLLVTAAYLSSGTEAGRMRDNDLSARQQGKISDHLLRLKQSPEPYPYRTEQRFLQALARGEQQQAQELLNELLGHILFASGGNIERIRNRVHELLILISRRAVDSGGDPEYIDRCLENCRSHMNGSRNVEELCLGLSKTVRSLMEEMFAPDRTRHSDLIHHTIQYLYSNYAKKLTLDEVAHAVHISPTYLSRVFKREVGASMVDYLNRIRIEKSKELLADGSLRLIEVALQCGFESQSYFNRMFRQSCDMTPSQYRKRMTE